MPIPNFELTQSDSKLLISIHAPNINIKDADLLIDGCDFRFYAKPYCLHLKLPGKLLGKGKASVQYHHKGDIYIISINKTIKGEYFKDLGMAFRFIVKKRPYTVRPRALSFDSEGNSENSLSEDEENKIDMIEEEGKEMDCEGACALPATSVKPKFGFPTLASQKRKYESPSPVQRKCGFKTPAPQKLKFGSPSTVQRTYMFGSPAHQKRKYGSPSPVQLKHGLGSLTPLKQTDDSGTPSPLKPSFIFETPSPHEIKEVLDRENPDGTPKLTRSNLKVTKELEDFKEKHYPDNLMQNEVITSVLNYEPLWQKEYFNSEERVFLLKQFLLIHSIFESSEPRHLLNKIYVNDYCHWIQHADEATLEMMADEIANIKICKDDIGFNLRALEAAAQAREAFLTEMDEMISLFQKLSIREEDNNLDCDDHSTDSSIRSVEESEADDDSEKPWTKLILPTQI
ncbi:hypothetical protein C0J52_10885 [Blattella germanica]|nr:hypothetical protein C0J52_10885 [Blattella germanica]